MDDNSGFPDNVPDELRAKLKQELDTDRVATLREMCAPHATLDEVSSFAPDSCSTFEIFAIISYFFC